MLFSSLEFLYLFLPLSLLLYFCCPLRWRNGVLFAVSLLFYGIGEPICVFLMLITVAADYGFGLWLACAARRGKRLRPILWGAVVWNVALLGFFKYYDLIAATLRLPTLGIALPAGISFYTFQALSYVIDVYRKEATAQKNIVAFGLYVTLFPQLIAGPIVRYSEIDAQLQHRKHSLQRIGEGISVFCVGLAKKTLFANPAGEMTQTLWNGEENQTVLGVWLWLVFYAFQIYFDFSGYSDMAIGLGRIFGFDLPQNFRYPYISRSITEFWRRWHITLSSWFREYVYIPLGGNRCGKRKTYRNLLITWLLTGLWHGAAWNFLLWGLYFFLLLVLEKTVLRTVLGRLPSWLQHGYALFFILLGWLLFAADGLGAGEALSWAGRMIGIGSSCFWDGQTRYELLRNLPFLLLMAVGATPLPRICYGKLAESKPKTATVLRNGLCLAALLFGTAYLVDAGYNPFLYFRF